MEEQYTNDITAACKTPLFMWYVHVCAKSYHYKHNDIFWLGNENYMCTKGANCGCVNDSGCKFPF